MGGWNKALAALGAVVSVALVARLGGLLGSLRGLTMLVPPGWLLLLLGLSQAGGDAGDGKSLRPTLPRAGGSEALDGGTYGTNKGVGGWWKRNAPSWLPDAVTGRGKYDRAYGNLDGARAAFGSNAHNLTALISAEAERAGGGNSAEATYIRQHLEGIRAGESLHRQNWYDKKDDAIESSWGPFQLNRRRGLGVAFEKETGLDVRDPKTIPAQVRWVAAYIKARRPMSAWTSWPTHGPMEANPAWGDSGYIPTKAPAAPDKLKSGLDRVAAAMRKHVTLGSFGAFDPDALRRSMSSAAPLGSMSSNNSRVITVHQHNTNHVTGVSDPTAAAAQIGARHDKHQSMLLRNLQSAIG